MNGFLGFLIFFGGTLAFIMFTVALSEWLNRKGQSVSKVKVDAVQCDGGCGAIIMQTGDLVTLGHANDGQPIEYQLCLDCFEVWIEDMVKTRGASWLANEMQLLRPKVQAAKAGDVASPVPRKSVKC